MAYIKNIFPNFNLSKIKKKLLLNLTHFFGLVILFHNHKKTFATELRGNNFDVDPAVLPGGEAGGPEEGEAANVHGAPPRRHEPEVDGLQEGPDERAGLQMALVHFHHCNDALTFVYIIICHI